MAERVDVGVGRVVVVGPDVVLGEAKRSGSDVLIAHHRHVVIRGRGIVDSQSRVQRETQRHGLAAANEPRSLENPRGSEVVEGAPFVIGPPAPPGGDGLEQLPELGGGQPLRCRLRPGRSWCPHLAEVRRVRSAACDGRRATARAKRRRLIGRPALRQPKGHARCERIPGAVRVDRRAGQRRGGPCSAGAVDRLEHPSRGTGSARDETRRRLDVTGRVALPLILCARHQHVDLNPGFANESTARTVDTS